MPAPANKLLLDIRSLKLPVKCLRIYTTVRKDGSFRVKFYNCLSLPNGITALQEQGWKLTIKRNCQQFYPNIPSITVIGSK